MELYLLPTVSLGCMIGGVWILKLAVGWRKKAQESEKWPSTPGKVLKSKLHLPNAARTSIGPDVSVTYEYSVDSQKFKNDKLAFYEVTTTKEATGFHDRFGSGTDVDVYYNPKNFEESVLVRGQRPDKKYHEFAMGIIVFTVGILLAYVHWEKFQTLAQMYWFS